MKAIVQCQGSTSLTMSAIAGLVPEITTIVSNAVSRYVTVPKASELKLQAFVPVCETSLSGLDAQWAVRAPSALATGFARVAHLIRGRDCDNEVCQVANYMYGVGRDILWRHANLDSVTHDWVSREFGYCPFSLLAQIGRAQRKGYLVPVDGLAQLPESLVDVGPMTDARSRSWRGRGTGCSCHSASGGRSSTSSVSDATFTASKSSRATRISTRCSAATRTTTCFP
jgi:hypothetical protein